MHHNAKLSDLFADDPDRPPVWLQIILLSAIMVGAVAMGAIIHLLAEKRAT
jgi:hypothetical protein